MANELNAGIINNYVKRPKNLTEYTGMRGVTDFTQLGQFAQYEPGYSFLSVLSLPKWVQLATKYDTNVRNLVNSITHMLEYEFRGLDGLPDTAVDNLTITNGIQEMNIVGKVTREASVTVSSSFFEKTGMPITKFTEWYLSGIKDPVTQAKTYHGLIQNGLIEPGPENEVFTFLYYVTDNTYLELERAVLLTNAFCTSSPTSNINGSRDDIGSNKEISLEFQCFPVYGSKVDQAAKTLLETITGVNVVHGVSSTSRKTVSSSDKVALDSSNYNYDAINLIK